MTTPEEALLVLTNLPDADTAARVARLLVEQRLAACVNILAPCTSVYRWQDQIETASEVPADQDHPAALPGPAGRPDRGPPLRTSRDHRDPTPQGSARLPGWVGAETLEHPP
jgi:periplasmic divalent cation tolerance protein